MTDTKLFYAPVHQLALEEATAELFLSDAIYPPEGARVKGIDEYLRLDDFDVYSRYVALTGGRVVGHVAVVRPGWELLKPWTAEGRYAEISRLFVLPEAAGHGVGRALFERALDYIDAFGARTILSVFPRLSPHAVKMYEAYGFEIAEELSPQESEAPGELVLIMRRPSRGVVG